MKLLLRAHAVIYVLQKNKFSEDIKRYRWIYQILDNQIEDIKGTFEVDANNIIEIIEKKILDYINNEDTQFIVDKIRRDLWNMTGVLDWKEEDGDPIDDILNETDII